MHCVLCLMSRLSIQNAYTCTHVSACNFLNIQRIFNPKKVLECWESGLFNHTIKFYICRCMSKQSIHCVQNKLHSMVCMSKQSIHCVLNKVHSMVRMSKQSIHCVRNTLHSMACMSRRSIQASNYIVYHNSNYSNKEIHRINALNYSLFRIKT